MERHFPRAAAFSILSQHAPCAAQPSSAFRPLHLPLQLHCPSGFPPGSYWGCSSSLSLSLSLSTLRRGIPPSSFARHFRSRLRIQSIRSIQQSTSVSLSVRLEGKCSPRNANATRALQPPRMEEEDFLGRKRTDSTVDGRTRTDERGASVPKCPDGISFLH